VKHKLFGVWHRSKFNSELDAELQFHLEELIAINKSAGMSDEQARQNALLRLGHPQQLKEACRDALWTQPLEDAVRDSSFAVRSMGKAGGLHLMTVLALALGIGCSTIVFSVVYNGVLHPFPYRSADRLFALRIDDKRLANTGFRYDFRLDEITAFRKQSHSFEDVVGYGNWYVTYAANHRAEVLHGGALTPNAMEFFGMPPLLGRGYTAIDSQVGAPRVVLLNYRFWKKEFNEDRSVIGNQMVLDDRPTTIIGVMPPRFQLLGADLYLPVSWNPNRVFEQNEPQFFWATGILKKGIKPETAVADLNVVAQQLTRIRPAEYPKQFTMVLTSLSDAVVADFRGMLILISAAVGILLLLSCSNAASLLLVRASARVKEMAMRTALGASRGRLIRQSLVETLVLALAGCGVGCAMAFLALQRLSTAMIGLFAQIPWEASISLNWPTLLFAIAAGLCSTLLAGLAPALYAGRSTVQSQLGGSGVGVNASFVGSRFRSALVICQVALSVVLLVSAALTVRSFVALTRANLGFQARNVFAGWIHFPKGKYGTAVAKREFVNDLLEKIAAIPGVTNVAESITRPLDGGPISDVIIPGKPHTASWDTMFDVCSEGYFPTLGLQLLHGRLLSAEDIASGRYVAVINQTLAARYFAHQDPLGRQIHFKMFDQLPDAPKNAYFEIVGVVSDFRNRGIAQTTLPEAFIPHSFTGFGDRGILVRTAIKPAAIQDAIQRILWDADPAVVLGQPATLENFINQNVYAKPRFMLIALSVCAAVGLLLSVIGTFSVMAYSTALRTHEMGVRLALGAKRSNVMILVLQKGMKLVGAGILFGFVAILLIAAAAKWQLWGQRFDPLTALTCAAVLAAAGLLACYLPALRATRVDTSVALRYE
jgi:putative ABC transport system permease protein